MKPECPQCVADVNSPYGLGSHPSGGLPRGFNKECPICHIHVDILYQGTYPGTEVCAKCRSALDQLGFVV